MDQFDILAGDVGLEGGFEVRSGADLKDEGEGFEAREAPITEGSLVWIEPMGRESAVAVGFDQILSDLVEQILEVVGKGFFGVGVGQEDNAAILVEIEESSQAGEFFGELAECVGFGL